MLKFFRKIRQQLLSENQSSKYLLYAAGEILLVMIGILLALQVNNWNTEKQEQKELNGYLHHISKNIQSDIAEMKVLKDYRDSTRAFSARIKALSKATTISQSEFYAIWSWDYNPYHTKYFNSDQSGFEALKYSGYLSKLRGHPVEFELYEYYNLVSEQYQEIQKLNDHFNRLSQKALELNLQQPLNELRYDTPAYSADFAKESKIILSILQHPIVVATHDRGGAQRSTTILYSQLIDLGTTIIERIESELNKQ